mmetsp:Transcript_27735/g.51602  ORF Transcript_27735/g.51602 Transcript_27735/m.51602 type:complete len:156 (+) Transcript_27735:841-1308(+)
MTLYFLRQPPITDCCHIQLPCPFGTETDAATQTPNHPANEAHASRTSTELLRVPHVASTKKEKMYEQRALLKHREQIWCHSPKRSTQAVLDPMPIVVTSTFRHVVISKRNASNHIRCFGTWMQNNHIAISPLMTSSMSMMKKSASLVEAATMPLH